MEKEPNISEAFGATISAEPQRALSRRYFSVPGTIAKSGFVRSVALLAGGTAAGQAVAVLASPLVTRLYTATDLGHFQMYASVLSFLMIIACGRYESAILIPEDDETAANVLCLSLVIVAAMVTLTFAVAVALSQTAVPLGVAEPLRRYLWILAVSLLGAGLYVAFSNWALRHKVYRAIALTKMTQSATLVTSQLSLGWLLKGGTFGLLLSDPLGRLNGILRLVTSTRQTYRAVRGAVSWAAMRQVAIRYRRFPQIAVSSALLDTAGFALPPLVLAQLYGAQVLGWFALTNQVMIAPNVLIAQSISQVFLSEIARVRTSEPSRLPAFYWGYVRKLLFLAIVPTAIVFGLGGAGFAFIFGEPWYESGAYARILALMYFGNFVASPLSPTLDVLERQLWYLFWVIVRLSLTVGGIVLASHLRWSARAAVGTLGFTMFLGYVALVVISGIAIGREGRRRYSV